MRTPIYIAGYPRSGNSWLSWLLGDLLDSPVERWGPALPLSAEGAGRPGKHVIHQLHLHVKHIEAATAIPDAWTFVPERWDGEQIVFIVRDPRDVVVSAMHYWEIPSLEEAILAVGKGMHPLSVVGPWSDYVAGWMEKGVARFRVCYEDLIQNPAPTLKFLGMWLLGASQTFNDEQVAGALARQNIEAKRKQVEQDGDSRPYGKGIQLKHLRKGQVGDWRNYFKPEHEEMAKQYFGTWMEAFGYVW